MTLLLLFTLTLPSSRCSFCSVWVIKIIHQCICNCAVISSIFFTLIVLIIRVIMVLPVGQIILFFLKVYAEVAQHLIHYSLSFVCILCYTCMSNLHGYERFKTYSDDSRWRECLGQSTEWMGFVQSLECIMRTLSVLSCSQNQSNSKSC